MTKRYEIWDKISMIFTPSGEVFTPEDWIVRYPASAYVPFVCAKGETKGAFFQSLSSISTFVSSLLALSTISLRLPSFK